MTGPMVGAGGGSPHYMVRGDHNSNHNNNYIHRESRPEICIPVEIQPERLFRLPHPGYYYNYYQKGYKQQWNGFHWEPIQFHFDDCKFFQFMLRYQDAASNYGKHSSPRVTYYFWLWTPSPPERADNYKFEVTLWNINEHSRHPPDVSWGRAQSLQHSAETILMHQNRKNIAYFQVNSIQNMKSLSEYKSV